MSFVFARFLFLNEILHLKPIVSHDLITSHISVANTFQPALEVATRGAETRPLSCKALKWGLLFNMAGIIEIRPGMYKLQPSWLKKKKSFA